MSGFETMGKLMMALGAGLVAVGALVWLLSKIPFLGRLPGDIVVERPGFTCLVPLVSSIVLSVVLTVVLNIVIRILKR
jgi:hypothetical protein